MPKVTITKTAHQYSAAPLAPEDMAKLMEIAEDCRRVKNYVYDRYSGIQSLGKLTPGYAIQNEMTKTGLRRKLGISVAYFYPAVYEAIANIKAHWQAVRRKAVERVRLHEGLTEEDKHYLYFILKIDQAFIAVLQRREVRLSSHLQEHHAKLSAHVDTPRLQNYLRRQVRKLHAKPHADVADGFSTTIDGYRYADHGLYLATKERRKRLFIPLTDSNVYTRQLKIRLLPDEGRVKVHAPLEVRARQHEDYIAEVGLAMGMKVMLTTHEGHTYGEELWDYHQELSEWLRKGQDKYQRNHLANSGRKKYEAGKHRREERLHSYINKEINRFLRTEKPALVCIMKFPRGNRHYGEKNVSYSINKWQRGYIRRQLMLKCREHSVEFVEVFGKDIGTECSQCGATGTRENGMFSCACGYTAPEKQNAAQNAKKRGLALVK